MNGKFSPPLLKFEKTCSSWKPGRTCKFTSTTDYNNIASITRTKQSSDTILLYHKAPASLRASIDLNVAEVFPTYKCYASTWHTNQYLKLESPSKQGKIEGGHTNVEGASIMESEINQIINGGKITKYYLDEEGQPIGVTTGGLEVPVDNIGEGVKLEKSKEDAGFQNTPDGGSFYDDSASKKHDEDEKSKPKYIIIGLAVVALIVTFIILKKKKKI